MSSGFAVCSRSSPHGPAEFLIGHAGVLLLLAPHLGDGLGLEEFEHPLPTVLPLHQALVLLGVDEDVSDELPQVGATWCCKEQTPISSLFPGAEGISMNTQI